jgi:hypothetical protein
MGEKTEQSSVELTPEPENLRENTEGRDGKGRFTAEQRSPGRKKGSKNKLPADIRKLVAANAGEIVAAMIAKAKAGNAHAGSALIRLVVSPLRESADAIRVDLPKIGTIEEAAGAIATVIAATTTGRLSPDAARDIVQMIGTLRTTIEAVDLEKRLAAIESKLQKMDPHT